MFQKPDMRTVFDFMFITLNNEIKTLLGGTHQPLVVDILLNSYILDTNLPRSYFLSTIKHNSIQIIIYKFIIVKWQLHWLKELGHVSFECGNLALHNLTSW